MVSGKELGLTACDTKAIGHKLKSPYWLQPEGWHMECGLE